MARFMINLLHLIVKANQNLPNNPQDAGSSFGTFGIALLTPCNQYESSPASALRGSERHITSGALRWLRELHSDRGPHLDFIWIFGVDAMDSATDFGALVHFYYPDQVGIVPIVAFRNGAGRPYGDGCEGSQLAIAFQFHPFHIAPKAFDTYRVRRQI